MLLAADLPDLPPEPGPPGFDWIPVAEFARRIGVTRHSANRLIREQGLAQRRLSRATRVIAWPPIRQESLDEIEDRHQRRHGGKGATMRRSRPDDPDGAS